MDNNQDEATDLQRLMQGFVEQITGAVNTLTETVAGVKDDVAGLKHNVAEVSDELKELRVRVAVLEGTYSFPEPSPPRNSPAPASELSQEEAVEEAKPKQGHAEKQKKGRPSVLHEIAQASRRQSIDAIIPTRTSTNDESDPFDVKSVKGSIFREIASSERQVASSGEVVMRQAKECNVRIDSFQLSKVTKAIKAIMNFQEEENTKVRVQKILSQACKEHLRSKYQLTQGQLGSLGITDLIRVIANETKVFSRPAFYKELEEALRHSRVMGWAVVSPVNHETFYHQQLKLISEFGRMLNIMLEGNKDWCPRIDDKPGGLIRLFKTCNDAEYFEHVWSCMTETKFKNMQEFFDQYTEIISDEYQLSVAVREIPYKCLTEHKERLRVYREKKANEKKIFSKPRVLKPLNAIEEGAYEVPDSDAEQSPAEEDDWRNYLPEPAAPTVTISADLKPDASLSIDLNESDEEEDEIPEHLHAVGPPTNSDKKYGCLQKILTGTCKRDNCKYLHHGPELVKAAKEMKLKIDKFVQGTSDSGAASQTSIMRREPSGTRA